MAKILITLVKSGIGYPEDQKFTLRSLGVKRLNSSIVQEDNQAIRGMISKVKHLVRVEEAKS